MPDSRFPHRQEGTVREHAADGDFDWVLTLRQVGNQQIYLQQADIAGAQARKVDLCGLASDCSQNLSQGAESGFAVAGSPFGGGLSTMPCPVRYTVMYWPGLAGSCELISCPLMACWARARSFP